jgi:hypothetical protein
MPTIRPKGREAAGKSDKFWPDRDPFSMGSGRGNFEKMTKPERIREMKSERSVKENERKNREETGKETWTEWNRISND